MMCWDLILFNKFSYAILGPRELLRICFWLHDLRFEPVVIVEELLCSKVIMICLAFLRNLEV